MYTRQHPHFRPSYGAAAVTEKNVTPATAQKLVDSKLTPPPKDSGDYTKYIEYFNQSAEALNQVLFGKDPRVAAAIKGAMVKNLKESTSKYKGVPIIGDYFKSKYRTTKAEYAALVQQGKTADIQDTLSIATKAGTVLIGVSLFALVLSNIALSRARTRAVSAGY
jgi:hypothetical protein